MTANLKVFRIVLSTPESIRASIVADSVHKGSCRQVAVKVAASSRAAAVRALNCQGFYVTANHMRGYASVVGTAPDEMATGVPMIQALDVSGNDKFRTMSEHKQRSADADGEWNGRALCGVHGADFRGQGCDICRPGADTDDRDEVLKDLLATLEEFVGGGMTAGAPEWQVSLFTRARAVIAKARRIRVRD